MDNGTFLCWMVKLTGSVKLVLFTDARMTVKTSEFISVLFSVRKYWWLSRLSIPLNVMKTTEAEPAPRGSKLVWKWERFCEGNAFVRNPASPLLALARACRFMSSVCPLADRATVLPSCSESSSFSGLMVCRLKSYREMKKNRKTLAWIQYFSNSWTSSQVRSSYQRFLSEVTFCFHCWVMSAALSSQVGLRSPEWSCRFCHPLRYQPESPWHAGPHRTLPDRNKGVKEYECQEKCTGINTLRVGEKLPLLPTKSLSPSVRKNGE